MKLTTIALSLLYAHNLEAMEMQHGFVLRGARDQFASHLVAEGHHSWQVEVEGQLIIADESASKSYQKLKQENRPQTTYFLFQAQNLNLEQLKEDEELSTTECTYSGPDLIGHIVQSPRGDYTPKNVIVKLARYKICRVLMNFPNPFFSDQGHH